MTEHRNPTTDEEGTIENLIRQRLIPGIRGVTDIAANKDLVGLSLHIQKYHPNSNFNEQMYRHLAAIGRREVIIPPATGSTADFNTVCKVFEFILPICEPDQKL